MTVVVFSPRARSDLAEIWDFTAGRWGADQADRYVGAIVATVDAVAAGEKTGRAVDRVRRGYRRIRSGSHLVFYRRGASAEVVVVRILHERMDVARHL